MFKIRDIAFLCLAAPDLGASEETNLVDPATVIGAHWGGTAR